MLKILAATISITILDAIWLGFIAKKLYMDNIGSLLRISNNSIQPIWPAAIVVYIALIAGILLFVLPKANGSLLMALIWGATFGFVTYATYDFTNLAVLSNWSVKISIIDTIWGMLLCGITSLITTFVSNLHHT